MKYISIKTNSGYEVNDEAMILDILEDEVLTLIVQRKYSNDASECYICPYVRNCDIIGNGGKVSIKKFVEGYNFNSKSTPPHCLIIGKFKNFRSLFMNSYVKINMSKIP